MKKSTLLSLLLLSLATGCATSPTGRSQFMMIPPEYAISQSKSAYIQALTPFQNDGKLDNDPEIAARVRNITGRLIAQAIKKYPQTRDWDWSIKVIDDPETVNAWCMAGGKMAIYTGLLQKIQPTDDEIAEVMGHEISHAVANHTAEKMSWGAVTTVAVAGVAVGLSDSENAGAYVAGTAALAGVGVTLPNSRTAETEADAMGIELAALAGYDPRAATTLWDKMGKVGGSHPPQFLSTHPAPENRKAILTELAQKYMPDYLDKSPRPVYKLKTQPLPPLESVKK
jgi:predicted Zn-dependent protease